VLFLEIEREKKSTIARFEDMIIKFNIKKFSCKNKFKLCRMTMEAILIQIGYVDAIKSEVNMLTSLYQKNKTHDPKR